MRIMAIDHGKRSGWVIVDGSSVYKTSSFTLESKSNNEQFYEFADIVDILLVKYKPDVLCIAEPKYMKNAETSRQLIGYYTLLIYKAMKYGIKVYECNEKSVRKVLTGYGDSEKVSVCDMLVSHLNIRRDMIEVPIYYKSKLAKYDGRIKEYVYDESDALALIAYYLVKECGLEWRLKGNKK